MDALITRESPLGADLALLLQRHTADMHAQTPPESIHMMDAGQLAVPDVSFFVLREEGQPIAMGAFKHIADGHGEIKSMHVLAEHRGRGLSKAMLVHLMDQAQAAGLARLSLETGAEPIFAPARGLYARAGFTYCAPFEGYTLDPNSVFMTKVLA
jgi:putative acetyltransferase